MVFAVNEGVTYQASPLASAQTRKELSADLTKLLKRPVTIKIVSDYHDLAAGLEARRYDIAYVHPAHHAVRAMTRSGYRLVCVTKGFQDYRARFLVAAGSPVKTLADLKGKTVGAPDSNSITSVLTRATLRDAGLIDSLR